MTTEEIKEQISMFDLLNQYGVTHRGNMCKCPFHGADNHPSMKVFKDGANCFTCGWNGDIFSFVQSMEHCDFKTAFKRLGGTYSEHKTKGARILSDRYFKAKKDELERNKRELLELRRECDFCLKILKEVMRIYEPEELENAHPLYVDAINDFEVVFYMWEQLYLGREVEKFDVIRKCKQIRHRYLTVG